MRPKEEWPVACPTCGCTSRPDSMSFDMEVYSSLRMDLTKFVVESCRQCGRTSHADGKEHGMLIVHYKVRSEPIIDPVGGMHCPACYMS